MGSYIITTTDLEESALSYFLPKFNNGETIQLSPEFSGLKYTGTAFKSADFLQLLNSVILDSLSKLQNSVVSKNISNEYINADAATKAQVDSILSNVNPTPTPVTP